MITGIAIAFLVALSASSTDILFSGSVVKTLPHLLKALVFTGLSIPPIALVVVYNGWPVIKPEFWWYVSIHSCLMTLALYLYMRALALGPVSQTQPILALTTVFLAITNPLMTNETVSTAGWAGVLSVGVGIYATQHPGVDPHTGRTASFLSPFREMLRQEGVRSKLGVAGIFSVAANLDRLALDAADGPSYILIDLTLITALLALVIIFANAKTNELSTRDLFSNKQTWYMLASGGMLHACTMLLQMWALTFTTVPYVIAVKRLSLVFVSLWGYFVRKERLPHWYRLAGIAIVFCGIALIVLFG